jgi:alkylhydroperoxidase family enzyme
MRLYWILPFVLLIAAPVGRTQEVPLELPKGAKPIPVTRVDMKKALDALKDVTPRLPLPSAEEGVKGVNNGRMRAFYVPEEIRKGGMGGFGGGFGKGRKDGDKDGDKKDGEKTDPTFNTKLFWIVCRVNNCQYCLGHQESGLASRGVPEETIAALDGDWSEFTDKEKLVFGLTRKLTFQPHLVGSKDLEPLKKYYTDMQIFNLVSSIAGFNAMNRWTDGLAIPQEKSRNFSSKPAAEKYKDKPSQVALLTDSKGCLPASLRRPAVTRAQIDKALEEARGRTPWIALASEDEARKLLPEEAAKGAVPNWVRLFALNKGGSGRVTGQYALNSKGNLDAKMRAQIDWIAAYYDRAWYALGQAEKRLRDLGESEKSIASLAGPWDGFSEKERAAFSLIRISTAAPMAVSDDDFVPLRKHYKEAQVAELVHRAAAAASFDRITEVMQVPLEK